MFQEFTQSFPESIGEMNKQRLIRQQIGIVWNDMFLSSIELHAKIAE
jgi:hypothetical protein